jgi:hypothetical protein
MYLPLKRDVPKSPFGANEQHWCHRQVRSPKRPPLFRFRTTIHIPTKCARRFRGGSLRYRRRKAMNKLDRRSALGIGLAAASAAMMNPAAAQTMGSKDTTPWPGVVVRAYDGETPSMIPGFKTVSMRDVIMQPGSKTMGPPIENAMVCYITEGQLLVEQEGKTFAAKKNFVWACNKATNEQASNMGNVVAIMRITDLKA